MNKSDHTEKLIKNIAKRKQATKEPRITALASTDKLRE
jgi:hypothetical protein